MTTTRIAGNAFDARDADRIRQTARIYSYTRRIRRLAADAAPVMGVAVVPSRDASGERTVPHPLHRPRLTPRGS